MPGKRTPQPSVSEEETGGAGSLIDWMLSLTPDERIQALQSWGNTVQALRNGR